VRDARIGVRRHDTAVDVGRQYERLLTQRFRLSI
jgi:hypothetical protein